MRVSRARCSAPAAVGGRRIRVKTTLKADNGAKEPARAGERGRLAEGSDRAPAAAGERSP